MRNILLTDMGGTYTRLAMFKNGRVSEVTKVENADFKTPEAAIKAYLSSQKDKPTDMIVAVAGAVYKGKVTLTNCGWKLSEASFIKTFNLKTCTLYNDFMVKGYSILDIAAKEIIQIGKVKADKKAPFCVIGPGTGLGIAFGSPTKDRWIIHSSEGGHTDIAAHTITEHRILEYLSEKDLTVSAEEVLSGRGLIGIYQALHAIEGIQLPKAILPEDLPWLLEKKDEMTLRTYQHFFGFLANFAGNMAITMKTTGGVYLLSNLLKPNSVRKALNKTSFRKTFENRGKMKELAKTIPTYLIIREHSAFVGLKKLAQILLTEIKK